LTPGASRSSFTEDVAAELVQEHQCASTPNVYLTAEQLHALAGESGRYGSLVLLLGTVGLRWGEAAAPRVSDVDFLRRRIALHENAVAVGGRTHVGTLKSGRSRSVALPAFVVDELAATCTGKDRDELIWPAQDGGYLAPPTNKSWMAGAVERCQKADKAFPRVTAHDLPLGRDDPRRVRRSFRLRLHCSCRQVI
jgi:integrase